MEFATSGRSRLVAQEGVITSRQLVQYDYLYIVRPLCILCSGLTSDQTVTSKGSYQALCSKLGIFWPLILQKPITVRIANRLMRSRTSHRAQSRCTGMTQTSCPQSITRRDVFPSGLIHGWGQSVGFVQIFFRKRGSAFFDTPAQKGTEVAIGTAEAWRGQKRSIFLLESLTARVG